MKSTFIGREKNEAKFKMEFTPEEFEKAVNDAYLKERGKYSIDGFRKGKAPRKLIESHYGEGVFYEEAINTIVSNGYTEALGTLELDPVDRPVVDFGDIEKGKDFEVDVTVTVRPVVEVKDYKGVKVKKPEYAIGEEEVQKELESLQTRNARLVVVDRPAQDGDTLLIDYEGYLGDVQFEGGTASGQPLTLGSNTFIPGFEEQLIGAAANTDIEINVTFPEDYQEDLADKDAVFKVKVREIKESQKPEINDEFAKDISEFDTLEDLKKDTLEKLEDTAKKAAERETKNLILEQIFNANELDIPDVMIEDQLDDMVAEFDQQLQYQGLDIQKYLQYMDKDITSFKDEMRDEAFKKVKTRLLVEAIANAENIEVSEEDVEEELQEIANQYKMELDQIRKTLGVENLMYLMKEIKMRKAVDFAYENAAFE